MWEAYRPYIIGSIIVVTAQLMLILGLLTQRARRRRAEETIRAREATLRTSYERIRQLAGTTHQRTGGGASGHRPGSARRRGPDTDRPFPGRQQTSNALQATFRTPQPSRPCSKLQHETLGIFDRLRRLSHELHPSTLATARPRHVTRDVLQRSREAVPRFR